MLEQSYCRQLQIFGDGEVRKDPTNAKGRTPGRVSSTSVAPQALAWCRSGEALGKYTVWP